MAYIRSVPFNEQAALALKQIPYGSDWPVVYIINNGTEAYVGETVDAATRISQHWMNSDRQRLKTVSIISDDTFNQSVTLDLKAFLIKHMSADGRFQLRNGNSSLHLHNYFNRSIYEKLFRDIWKQLQSTEVDVSNNAAALLALKDIETIENSDIFKYSPYTALRNDQFNAVVSIIENLRKALADNRQATTVIQGGPGTGKTILAVYMMKLLSERTVGLDGKRVNDEDRLDILMENLRFLPDVKMAFVVPMQSLRKTLKEVFSSVRGLNPEMIISPIDVPKSRYDLLIVDEAHRLRQRKALAQYPPFDQNNKVLGLGNKGTELDWIMMCSKCQVFFYDDQQSIKPADIDKARFDEILGKTSTVKLQLKTQFRCKGGDEYIRYIGQIMSDVPPKSFKPFDGYDLLLFDDIEQMVTAIREKDAKYGLCRTVAGYSWKWVSKEDPERYDIAIQGHKYRWNTTDTDWVNSPTSLNEIGCIHTIQGYDLNYAGVIFGTEVDYDETNGHLMVDKDEYQDITGKASVTKEPEKLLKYICNIYRTMMTRGIRGTYVYACNRGLRNYLARYIEAVQGNTMPAVMLKTVQKPIPIAQSQEQSAAKKEPPIIAAHPATANIPDISVGMFLKHKVFGEGKCTWIDKKAGRIKVAFHTGERTFSYPDALVKGFLLLL